MVQGTAHTHHNMKSLSKVAVLAFAVFAAVDSLKADIVYDNGPINGTLEAWSISGIFSVSSSFMAPVSATLTSATIGLWADATPASLSWSIGTTAFGVEISSGTAALSSSTSTENAFGFLVFESSFDIAGVVDAGTYYLTLSSGSDSNQELLFWDINNGPSTTYEFPEHLAGTANALFEGSNSPSFTVHGEIGDFPAPGAVPDASASLALLVVGLGAVHGLRRRLA